MAYLFLPTIDDVRYHTRPLVALQGSLQPFAVRRILGVMFLQVQCQLIGQNYDQWFLPTLFSFSTLGTLYVAIVAILMGRKSSVRINCDLDTVFRHSDRGLTAVKVRTFLQAID